MYYSYYKGSGKFSNPQFEDCFKHCDLLDVDSVMITKHLHLNFGQAAHVLIAGMTGSGKTCLMHSMILSLLYNTLPSEAQFIFIDPKRVEFTRYRNDPHTHRIARDVNESIAALADAEAIMRNRYIEMERKGIEQWTGKKIYIVIDELADLIFQDKARTVKHLSALARLGRAAGMHLICATQTPRRDVLSNQVMSNFPAKIILHCDTPIDYRTVLGCMPPAIPEEPGEGFLFFRGKYYHFQAPYVSRSDYEYFLKTCDIRYDRPEVKIEPPKKEPLRGFLAFLGLG